MIIIAVKKNNKIYYGSATKVAKLIGIHPATINRWIKAKKEIEVENGFEVYLNTEKL
jgi:DNA-binding transcriptional regulator YdaS (Cro superfamily)